MKLKSLLAAALAISTLIPQQASEAARVYHCLEIKWYDNAAYGQQVGYLYWARDPVGGPPVQYQSWGQRTSYSSYREWACVL